MIAKQVDRVASVVSFAVEEDRTALKERTELIAEKEVS